MPYADTLMGRINDDEPGGITPTGLAALRAAQAEQEQQAAAPSFEAKQAEIRKLMKARQLRLAGGLSGAERQLINQGVRIPGGYMEVDGQVVLDQADQFIPLSDASKAYLALKGVDPKLAELEAETAKVKSNQRELFARNVAEGNLRALRTEARKGLMSVQEYGHIQDSIIRDFQEGKAPSMMDYLSTAEDEDDPKMQMTRYKDNVKNTLVEWGIPETEAANLSGLTVRDKDGVLQNKAMEQLATARAKAIMEGPANQRQQMQAEIEENNELFKLIPEPDPQQVYGYLVRKNEILRKYGQPEVPLPEMVEAGGFNPFSGFSTYKTPQSVDEMFSSMGTGTRVTPAQSAPTPPATPAPPKPQLYRSKEDVRKIVESAKAKGENSVVLIDPQGVITKLTNLR